MKKINAILSAAAVLLVSAGSCISVSGLEYCETLTYIVSENETIITGYCGNPEVINLPSEIENKPVTEIRENAFYRCSSLTEITLPESVSEIGHHAFFECTSLETVKINGEVDCFSEGVFYGCESLRSIDVRNTAEIDDYAFFGCLSLEKFRTPQGVTEIGEYAFYNCLSLSEISFGNKLHKIGSYAFFNCPELPKISFPENLNSIGQYAAGFSDNGLNKSFEIVGMPDTIAEHYAKSNGIDFRQRITSQRSTILTGENILSTLIWLIFAVLYGITIFYVLPAVKKRRRAFR